MTALLVGGDRLGNIPNTLEKYGIKEYIHWTGRKKGMRNCHIPSEASMVIVFYDFIEHNITHIVKKKAKQSNIPCVFSKRACTDLAKKLDHCKECKGCV
ncbi:DUF2325 domain-containing protein [Alkalicella caledoniensis]|uniref:DUF2325 domain-containing protein n=1 Tax=Alkalicella caledoniensis TaxID=2731377 RepID=A0A7G9W6D6_ALKCA|nr:DUF2325 domain-containing protein [Alkalicella caledoniensis]QNO14248.1 DUF2325 domain-containing protein [Alkalicella caledoniensis]